MEDYRHDIIIDNI